MGIDDPEGAVSQNNNFSLRRVGQGDLDFAEIFNRYPRLCGKLRYIDPGGHPAASDGKGDAVCIDPFSKGDLENATTQVCDRSFCRVGEPDFNLGDVDNFRIDPGCQVGNIHLERFYTFLGKNLLGQRRQCNR